MFALGSIAADFGIFRTYLGWGRSAESGVLVGVGEGVAVGVGEGVADEEGVGSGDLVGVGETSANEGVAVLSAPAAKVRTTRRLVARMIARSPEKNWPKPLLNR